jgi:hypothetical protein
VCDDQQKLKNNGGRFLYYFLKDFALRGKSMSSVLVFWCLDVNLMLDFLVCSTYLGFLISFVCSRR